MSSVEDPIRVLHVDDEDDVRLLVAERLERAVEHISVEGVGDPDEALDRIDGVDCLVTDYRMPGTDGLELLSAVRETRPDLPVVMLSGEAIDEMDDDPIEAGVDDYVQKDDLSTELRLLARRIVTLVEHRRLSDRGGGDRDDGDDGDDESDGDGTTAGDATDRGDADRDAPGSAESEDPDREGPGSVEGEGEDDDRNDGESGEGDDRRLERLHERVADLQTLSTREAVYEAAVRAAVEVLAFDWSVIHVVDDEWLVTRASSEASPVAVGDRVLRAGEGVAGCALGRGESVVTEDVHEDPDGRPVDGTLRSGLTVPIGDLGVFQAAASTVEAFDDYDCRLAELLVTHVEAAVDRVDREAALRERERRLERQNERLDRFASLVSHDLRNPLEVARAELELASAVRSDDGDESIDGESESDHLAEVARAHERMADLIDDLLAIARSGQGVEDLDRVDLAGAARESWATVVTDGADLVVEDAVVEADPQRLRELLENLFRNSVEHGSTGSRPSADDSVEHGSTGRQSGTGDSVEHGSTGPRTESGDSVEHGSRDGSEANDEGTASEASEADRGDGDGVTVRVGALDDDAGFYVEDDGVGIPPGERESVFESGYSTAEDNTGFGLAIVAEIVEAHGWALELTESEAGGARFEIRT